MMPLTPPTLTLGLEEEYLLVDPVSRDLVATQPETFMARCQERLGGRVTHEFLQAQVEVGTPVCASVAEVRRELAGLRGAVAEVAREHGMAMIAASTHPFANWRHQKKVEKERYIVLSRDMQTLSDRLVICGMHIHAGIEDEELRIDLMNQVGYFLPHLLALSTSSPFWEGRATGLKAYRPTIFGDLPRSGLPETFDSAEEYHLFIRQLADTGLCDDATKIWWDIRPSARYPTLELRVCDVCTRLDDAISIAALYQAILATLYRLRAANQTWRRYRMTLLEENKWLAQRNGVRGRLADYGAACTKPFPDLLEEIIEIVADQAERMNCQAEVEAARSIIERGTSADQQLAVFAKARADGADESEATKAVVDWLIQETVAGLEVEPMTPPEPARTAGS
ncbi:MAG TPA: carboxylate-amine ligase [Geminicoccaceae bacterium]